MLHDEFLEGIEPCFAGRACYRGTDGKLAPPLREVITTQWMNGRRPATLRGGAEEGGSYRSPIWSGIRRSTSKFQEIRA